MAKLLAVALLSLALLGMGGVARGGEEYLTPMVEEVVTLVRQKALYPPRAAFPDLSGAMPGNEEEVFSGDVENALKAYVHSVDNYSFYLTLQEKKKFLAPAHHYYGVGMDLLQDNLGALHCVPYAGTPADKAGIVQGDMLESVDGFSVEGVPLALLEGRIRGKAGTTVRLGIVRMSGERKELSIRRASISQPSVELLYDDEANTGNFPRLKIYRFGARTKYELLLCLDALPEGEHIILDLRGNVGGSLEAARQCAELFLSPGAVLYGVRNNTGVTVTHKASQEGPGRNHTIVIWQDSFTASAAEVFCAALRYNNKAVVLGQKSFGKGLVQTVFPCVHGGLLIMTTDELLLPNGAPYNGLGIEPNLLVSTGEGSLGAFFRRSEEVFNSEETFMTILKDIGHD